MKVESYTFMLSHIIGVILCPRFCVFQAALYMIRLNNVDLVRNKKFQQEIGYVFI